LKFLHSLTCTKIKNKNNKFRLLKNLTYTFFLSALTLTLYELLKQLIFPHVTIWQSHTITILVGSFVSVVAVFIVSRKQQVLINKIEKSKTEAENALKIREDFMYTISHEFKTPLNVIYSAVQVMELVFQDDIPNNVKKYIKSIKQNTFRQMKLVNNLLDLTKIESGYMEIFEKSVDIMNLTELIVQSVYVYADQKKVKINFMPFIKNKIVVLDEGKYERILLNLISNAIKFTPEGKSIYIKISEKNNDIKIEIIDEGVGIPKEKQKFIFKRFVQVDNTLTRKVEGTGIGLSIVKLLISLLEWEISLDSQEGIGSNFTITIPNKKIYSNTEVYTSDLSIKSNTHNVDVELSDIY
jgi:Signal transduction histidine kinase